MSVFSSRAEKCWKNEISYFLRTYSNNPTLLYNFLNLFFFENIFESNRNECFKRHFLNIESNLQGPQRQNVQSNMPIIVHNTDFLVIKMVLVHS